MMHGAYNVKIRNIIGGFFYCTNLCFCYVEIWRRLNQNFGFLTLLLIDAFCVPSHDFHPFHEKRNKYVMWTKWRLQRLPRHRYSQLQDSTAVLLFRRNSTEYILKHVIRHLIFLTPPHKYWNNTWKMPNRFLPSAFLFILIFILIIRHCMLLLMVQCWWTNYSLATLNVLLRCTSPTGVTLRWGEGRGPLVDYKSGVLHNLLITRDPLCPREGSASYVNEWIRWRYTTGAPLFI